MLRFFHISDSHIEAASGASPGDNKTGTSPDVTTAKNQHQFERVIDYINKLLAEGLNADFLIHTGDICNRDDRFDDDGCSFMSAMSILDSCNLNKLYLNGNHDKLERVRHQRELETIRFDGKMERISELTPGVTGSFYAHIGNHVILVLDARPRNYKPLSDGCHPDDPSGTLLSSEILQIEQLVNESSDPIAVFMHYPPINLDSLWVENSMCVNNGAEIHQIFQSSPEKISGVFFGHVHHSLQVLLDNVLYVSVGATSVQFDTSNHLQEHLSLIHI